ncbi:prolyl oligopeptidase family serine peptidase [Flavihumibacter stibioxidans]|uniref:Peptidase S9 prolyl oligopeptidase catalytic domain-containing protein n=1 Tax=Flavihumibacter stibioxidans TaxID=1834163 RepID=A0ABR7M5X4_9BACT|nr:prolyl oligopeptidase family serine peptidase [Flavihumibacter stibioxidans]MBC6489998.1 hypothetical protein [Flavihumibacter stibioxidans]
MRIAFLVLAMLTGLFPVMAQKKPMDHSVYDGWQSIGEKLISADGRFLAYTVTVQEGDGMLVVKSADQRNMLEIPRGYQAAISDDSRFLVAKIRPYFKDTRQARIKKTPPNDMPKDSLVILELATMRVQKFAGVKSYKMPEKGESWLAYHLWKVPGTKSEQPDSLARLQRMLTTADSLARVADSLRNKVTEARVKGINILTPPKNGSRPGGKSGNENVEEGTELVVKNLVTGKEFRYQLVSDYLFNKNGQVLVIETTRKNGDSLKQALVLWHELRKDRADTVLRRFQDVKGYAITDDGTMLAFVAERDSSLKALKKYYSLWSYQPGNDSARMLAGRTTGNINTGLVISPDFNNYFSKDGSKLFFGLAPDRPVKDTSLVEFETARLDVWNYRDDYLQPQQLVQLNNELKRSWLTVIHTGNGKLVQLGTDTCEMIFPSVEGNGRYALGTSNHKYRVQQQWSMDGMVNLYLVDLETGSRKPVAEKVSMGMARISPAGQYISWYDVKKKNWMVYDIKKSSTAMLTKGITVPLYDEEDDHPADPPPHGLMGWQEGDRYAYVYDKYDIWRCDPSGTEKPFNLTGGEGRKLGISLRYTSVDPEQKFIKDGESVLFSMFDHKSKGYGWQLHTMGHTFRFTSGKPAIQEAVLSNPVKSRNAGVVAFTRQTPASLDIYQSDWQNVSNPAVYVKMSNINPQQSEYNWFSVELHRWKMLDGKMSEGLLYKPENFDPKKKYPVIFYFYEKNADRRFFYIEPMPVRASVNIAYYTSNGYLVFDPNIYYKTGQPGEDAYNSVVSAAKYLSRQPWVDSTKMGLQGHSWGGYQIAYLITRTNMFAAAEAGAPVSNMTSAYGGIRWGTGLSRQFQYERTQSRIGATLWEKPELYLKNSPLFRADKVKTPLLMLHNDKDDAVPWYQGIEYFTALRRLGKPVWMINYNDELHGIIERRNRKDWTIRMAQFFDHYLKGAPAPKWLKDGVPATLKGIDWGLGY